MKKRPKQLQKSPTMKSQSPSFLKQGLGNSKMVFLSRNMYPAFSNGLKHDTFRTRYLVFVCLFVVVVVVVVVVCSNNPNLSCHLQVYLLH